MEYPERMFQAYREGWDHVIGRLRTLVPPSPFEKVDTVIIRVQDLERARVWYEEKVGLRAGYVGTDERLAVLRGGRPDQCHPLGTQARRTASARGDRLRLPRSGTQTGIIWRCAAPSAYLVAAGRRESAPARRKSRRGRHRPVHFWGA